MDIGSPDSKGPKKRLSRSKQVSETALSHRIEFETLEPRVLMSADLLPVHGSIDVPGQANSYNFTLASAEQVYFDSLTPHSGGIDWSLTGPSGVQVQNRSFEASDASNLSGPAALSLVPGNYVLNVTGSGNATGAYGFQLLNLANAAPITPGQPVAGEINPGDSTALYQFNGVAGQTVFFDSQAVNSQSTSWRAIGPDNQLVFGPQALGQDPAPATLERTGTYTVMIEGNVDQTAPADYNFTVFPVTTNQASLDLGQTVAGTLATPGQTDHYSFTVTQPTSVLFDSLSNRGDVQWTLSGNTGNLVTQRSFSQSDGTGIGGDASVALTAGTYTVSVAGVGAATGAYGFQLLDLSQGTPSDLSQVVSGTIDDAGFAAQSLHTAPGAPLTNAAANEAITFGDATISANVAHSPVLRPASVTVEAWVNLNRGASGQANIVTQGAPGAGYALLVGSDGNLQFQAGGGAVEAPTALQAGQWTHVAGTYDGTTLRLYVNGQDVADQAYATPIAYDGNGFAIGADVSSRNVWQGAIDEVRVWDDARSAGDIAANENLELGPQADLVGLWHFNETAGLTLADSSGNGNDATLGPIPGTATQLLSFDLTAGQTYYLNAQSSNGDITERFYSPAGYLLFKQQATDRSSITPEVSGTYTLALEGDIGNDQPASYSLQLVPSTPTLSGITVGNEVADSIGLPGQAHAYSFTLGNDSQLEFDTLYADSGLQWSLTGPRGTEVTNRDFQQSDGQNFTASPLLSLPAGDYTLTVTGEGDSTGNYGFRLLDAANATPFSLGDDVTATLDQPAGTVLYSFAATAGDVASFDIQNGQDQASWRLLDPYGREVFGPTSTESQDGVALQATGTYILSIEGALGASNAATIQFASNLDSHTDPAPLTGTPITVGTAVDDSFATANSTNQYVFNTNGASRLYFDSLTASPDLTWSLTGPRGTEVTSQNFYSSDAFNASTPAAIDLPLAGTYQLSVSNDASFTGGYAFNLLDLTNPVAVLPTDGSTISGTLNPADSTQVYAFDATAGTNVFLNAGGSQSIAYRLLDPYGRQVAGPAGLGSTTLAIQASGRYTLLVEGDISNTGTASYTLGLTDAVDPAPAAIALNAEVDGQLAAPSQTTRYTFDLASDTNVILSSFTSDSNAQLALIGPNGTIFTENLQQAVNYPQGTPIRTLAAGSYTVAITSTSPTDTLSYGFRLLDVGTAVALTPGTTVNATLGELSSVDAYTVTAQAGTQLRLVGSSDRGEPIVVLDPTGAALPQTGNLASTTDYAITQTGTYTILVEGRLGYYDFGNTRGGVAYSLTAYVDPAPTPLAIGATATGTLADNTALVRYTFTLSSPSTLVLDTLGGDPTLTMTGPDGYYLNENLYYSDSSSVGGDPALMLADGTYTISLVKDSSTTYAFRLLDLATATPLTSGAVVSGTDAPGDATTLYSFTATSGQVLSLATTNPSNNLRVRVLDPYGQQVSGSQNVGTQLITAAATGVYTVLLEGVNNDGAASEPYTIAVNTIPEPTVALNGLSSASGPFSSPGVIGTALAFTGQEHIDVPDQPAVELGTAFTLQAWINPDQFETSYIPIIVKGGGSSVSYGLYVTNGDQILFKISDATNTYNLFTNYGVAPINQWTQITATLDPVAGLMTIYINGVQSAQQSYGAYNPTANSQPFEVAADQSLGQNGVGTFEGLIDDVRLWNTVLTPAQITANFNVALAGNEAGLALYLPLNDATGATVIADKGPSAANGSVVSAFAGLNNVVEGRIATAFETDTYTFTLAQATTLVIDGLSDDNAFSLTLTGPNGLSITRTIVDADSFYLSGNPLIDAAAGAYTLTISANSPHIGSYAFRLLDLSSAVPIALNTPVDFTLPTGYATQAFTFAANAGDSLLLDTLVGSSSNISVRIIDPLGRVLTGPLNFSVQTGLPTLALTGTYTLLIEGATYNRSGPVQLGFALDKKTTTLATLQIGAPNANAGPVWGAGITPGQGLTFTGADEVTVPDGAVTAQTGSFTIDAMVKLDQFDGYTPIATKVSASIPSTGGQQRAYGLYVNADGSVVATTRDANGDQSVTSAAGLVKLGMWVELSEVVDRTFGTLSVLVNGVVVATTNIRTTPGIAVDGPLVIGGTQEADSGYGRLVGAISSVRLWNVARSAGQLASDMVTPPASNSAGLVLDLPFTEGSGTVSANTAPAGGNATLVSGNTNGITGNLTQPGVSNAYNFSVTQTTQIVIDALSSNPLLRWTITGPYGTIASNLFTQTNGFDNYANPVITLEPGSYTFTVSADGDGAGYYNIRLVDIAAQATPLTLGTAVSGVLDPADQTQVYSFTAAAKSTLFFDPGAVQGEVSWQLIDPFGRQLVSPQGFNISSTLLPYAGTYTILVQGRAYEQGRSDYSFNALITPTITTPLTIGATVDDAISTPSEINDYTFTLNAATQLVFDSLTNNNQFNWTLTGPTGVVVNARGFASSDGGSIGGSTVLDLPPGAYTLSVVGNNATTGSYGFRLLDVAAGTPITLDTPVTGTLGDNGTDTTVYLLTATARERVDFGQGTTSDNQTTWRLMDQFGNLVFGPNSLADSGPLTLNAGTYILLIEGGVGETAPSTYGFTVATVPQQSAAGQTTQDFDTPNLLAYTLANFSGPAAAVNADGVTGNGLRLTSGAGGNVDNAVYFPVTQDSSLSQVTVDFDFRVTLDSAGDENSTLLVALLDADTWGDSGTGPDLFSGNAALLNSLGITIDTNNNDGGDGSDNHVSVRTGGGLVSQQFVDPAMANLASGTPVHATITVAQTDGGALVTVVLTPQGGSAVTAVNDLFVGGYQLHASRVAIGGQSYYANATQDIDNVAIAAVAGPDPAAAITIGQTVSGSILVPNAVERYAFDVSSTTEAVFDDLTSSPGNLVYAITGPAGTIANSPLYAADSSSRGGSNLLTLTPGHYVVTISDQYQQTAPFSFRLLDTSTATPITIGTINSTPTTAMLNPGNDTLLFSFSATAGQIVYLANLGGQPDVYVRILDPNGQLITGPDFIDNIGPLKLTIAGTYLLSFEGQYDETAAATVQFALVDAGDTVSTLTPNQAFTGTVSEPGQRDIHTFTLTQATILYPDALTDDGNLNWQLIGPNGVLASRSFTNTDGAQRSSTDPVGFYAPAGTYQFIVTRNGDGTGAYSFNLLDLSTAPSLTLGADTPITLNPQDSTQAFSITAAAGEALHLSAIGGNYYTSLRLLDNAGNLIAFQENASLGVDTPVIPVAGTYTLLVEGYISGGTGAQAITVRADEIVDGTQATTLGSQVDAVIATPGQRQNYTFTVSSATNVLIDPLGYDGRFNWILTYPDGSTVTRTFDRSLNFYGGYYNEQQQNPLLLLGPGQYTLSIGASANATGTGSLRIIDSSAQPFITPGVPVSAALAPVGAANVYQLAGAAGDEFYFKASGQTGGDATWALIDPQGNIVFYRDFDSDAGLYKLASTGTYQLLLLDENNDYAPPLSYTFDVLDDTPSAPVPITTTDTTPAPDLQVQSLAVSAPGGTIQSDAPITISWQDANTGTLPTTGVWTDRVVITNLTTGQIVAEQSLPTDGTALAAQGTLARSISVLLPSGGLAVGQLQVVVTTDVTNAVSEHNPLGTGESNNAAAVTVTASLASYPDLIPTVVTATPAGAYTPGQQVTAAWTTSNQGTASTGTVGWTEQLIVTDLTTGHQIELASIVQPNGQPLAAGASVARSVTFAWPTGLDSTGNFSFVVNVDTTDQIVEANPAGTGETNNRSELDVLSAPDLTVTGLQATNAAQAGGQLTLQWTDVNNGTVGTPNAWSDRVTIYNTTTNQTIVDTVVPANPGSSLLPGGTLARSVTVTLPTGLAGGGALQVSVTVNRDINNAAQITEASANGNAPYNNTQQINVTSAQLPYADLTASNLSIPASGTGGGTIAVGWTVTNTGSGPTNVATWNDEVVFSPTATLNPATEIVLGTFAHTGVLTVGASYSQQQNVALPLQFNGTGYIAVLTDPTGAVAEPARGQEYITGPLPIAITAPYADLTTEAVSAPGTANAGSTISVSWRVRNLGTAATSPTGGWTDQVYLATTDTVTPGSILLGTVPHSTGLAVGASYTGSASLVVPSGLTGAYHVLVVTNANNADFENGLTANDTGEAPGALLINAQPSADLTVTAVSIPAATVPGVPTPVTFTVQNIGQTVARGPWTDQLVLLYGPNLASSVALTSVQHPGDLQVGASYTVTVNVTLPSLPDGTVEIAAQTNSGGVVQEAGRTSNNTLDSATFSTTHPDLVPAQVQAPATIVSGQPLTVSWTDVKPAPAPHCRGGPTP